MAISSWRRLAAAACLLAGVGGAAQFRLHFRGAHPDSVARLGRPLPPLPVDDSGIQVDLRKVVAGRRSVVVFYSPSCRVCEKVLPALKPFPAGLRLVMVSESSAPVQRNVLLPPAALSYYDRWYVLGHSFALAALPTILFVDENGILGQGLVGPQSPESVQARLREFASEPGREESVEDRRNRRRK